MTWTLGSSRRSVPLRASPPAPPARAPPPHAHRRQSAMKLTRTHRATMPGGMGALEGRQRAAYV